MSTCQEEDQVNRVAPGAVLRTLIANLKNHKRLSNDEQALVLIALKNTDIPVDRILADMSRQTLQTVLSEI